MRFSPPLLPIKYTGETPREEIFSTADIETSKWVNFLCIGYMTKHQNIGFKWFKTLRHFTDWIFSPEQPTNIMYCHFGGGFDFLFLLEEFLDTEDLLVEKMIPRGSKLLCFDVSLVNVSDDGYDEEGEEIKKKRIISESKKGVITYRERTISFYDSSAMLPFGLESLCENFGVEHKKLKIDHTKTVKVTPQLVKYLEHDCRGHYEVIEKYQKWMRDKFNVGVSHTMASQSMKVFRTFLKKPIRSLSGEADLFVRDSYVGGRTEIFKPLFLGDKNNLLNCADVNSLYPYVMSINDMPTNYKGEVTHYDPKSFGFYEATVRVPEDMYVPPLGTKVLVAGEEKFIFPTGVFSGKWSSIELEYARSIGVEILHVGKGHVFKNGGTIFKDFILELYKIRENSSPVSVDNILAKLLMNSCYGKFALRLVREGVIIDDGMPGAEPIFSIKTKNGEEIRFAKEVKILESSFANAAVAAWVTSHARIHMHKMLLPIQDSLHYMDTDSMFSQGKFQNEKGLGKLKIEYECDSACFLLPKTYLIHSMEDIFKYVNEHGDKIKTNRKIVMKGFDKKKIQHFEMEDFMEALEGELRLIKERLKDPLWKKGKNQKAFLEAKQSEKIATFKTAIREGKLVTLLEESARGIRSVYDKRKIIKLDNGKFDTEPLVIRDNKIVNWYSKPESRRVRENDSTRVEAYL